MVRTADWKDGTPECRWPADWGIGIHVQRPRKNEDVNVNLFRR